MLEREKGILEWGRSDFGLFANVEDVMFIRQVAWEIAILATFTQCPANVQHLHYLN